MSRARVMRRLPRSSWTLLTATALVATAFATRPVTDPSPWLHLKVGQFLLDGHRFGTPDPFAPYATKTYEPTQWLPSVVNAVLYQHLGLPSVAWARTACIAMLALALIIATRRVARPAVALCATAVAMLGAWPALTERPQTLGFVLLVVSVAAWWRSADTGVAQWWLIPLTWVSACVHGVWSLGVVLGGAVVAALVLERRHTPSQRYRMLGVLGGCVAAAALTPLGPRLLLSPFEVGSNGREFVSEWMASSIRMPSVALTVLALAGVFAVWAVRGERPPLWKLVLWVAALAFALFMVRTVPVAAIIGALLVADSLEAAATERSMRGRWVPAAGPLLSRRESLALAAAALVAVGLAVPLAAQRGQEPRGVPTALAAGLRAIPAGTHVISDGDLSGWLMFQAPRLRPISDIRIEVYSPEHIRGYIGAMHAQPGWAAYLTRAGTKAALLKADAPLVAALEGQWHWTAIATDHGYVLLEAR
jgi:hypothetical protein